MQKRHKTKIVNPVKYDHFDVDECIKYLVALLSYSSVKNKIINNENNNSITQNECF